ncbi:hypothetical protein IKQ38_02365 [Candidatus Saccharibacteria bacterium]|nr:hypothetical protein [Candidatus Saccharibacteria bacterium]
MATKNKIPVLNILLIIIGLVLIGLAIVNKNQTTAVVDTDGNEVIFAKSDIVSTGNQGKLVAISDKVAAGGNLTDKYFGISKKTYKLKRVVEMYQYKLNEDTNEYLKVWNEEVIDSSSYDANHKNPDSKAFTSEEYFENNLSLGAFALTDKLVNDIDYDTVLGPDEISSLYTGQYTLTGEYITNTADMDNPKIGDFRISYKYAKDKTVTVIAKQNGNSFEPFYSDNKKEVYSLEEGELSAADFTTSTTGFEFNVNFIISLIGIAFVCFGVTAIVFANIKSKKVK